MQEQAAGRGHKGVGKRVEVSEVAPVVDDVRSLTATHGRAMELDPERACGQQQGDARGRSQCEPWRGHCGARPLAGLPQAPPAARSGDGGVDQHFFADEQLSRRQQAEPDAVADRAAAAGDIRSRASTISGGSTANCMW